MLSGAGALANVSGEGTPPAYPTMYILDPAMQVREILEGTPVDNTDDETHDTLVEAANNAFDAFIAENPGWTSPF